MHEVLNFQGLHERPAACTNVRDTGTAQGSFIGRRVRAVSQQDHYVAVLERPYAVVIDWMANQTTNVGDDQFTFGTITLVFYNGAWLGQWIA